MRIVTKDEAPKLDSILVHGVNGVGKTSLLASFIAHESQYGPCAYIYVSGEPALTSIRNFDLSNVTVIEVTKVEDFLEIEKTLKPQHAIAFDSLAALNELADTKATGGTRAPGVTGKGEGTDGRSEWGVIKFHVNSNIERLKNLCTIFMAACPSDRDEDSVTKTKDYIMPALVGKLASRITGRFSFVGYMEAVGLNPTTITRQVSFHFRADALTRANVKNPFVKPITIPKGVEGWATIKDALLKAIS